MSDVRRKYKPASGLKKVRDVARRIKILKRKVKRWERYTASGKPCGGKIPASKKINERRSPSTRSRHNNWDTTKLKKYIKFLESVR